MKYKKVDISTFLDYMNSCPEELVEVNPKAINNHRIFKNQKLVEKYITKNDGLIVGFSTISSKFRKATIGIDDRTFYVAEIYITKLLLLNINPQDYYDEYKAARSAK